MTGAGDTANPRPRKHNNKTTKMRCHDYLYDSSFILSGARDYARTCFKAAVASAQPTVQPIYANMFSETRSYPRMQVVYTYNCRLPGHIDKSYNAYLDRVKSVQDAPIPELMGKDRFKYVAVPRISLEMTPTSPDFHPPTPAQSFIQPTKPVNKKTQSIYRESSAQTVPWEAPPKVMSENTPEVLYLGALEWGPGKPYRTGDLPADFHTTEIINKMRHARTWNELLERSTNLPQWMKKRDAIICDVETKDWIFREAEIDELQSIRLELLHKLQTKQRLRKASRTTRKLEKLWNIKKEEMEHKIEKIRKTKDREVRKLTALHESGGASGLLSRLKAARGMGSMTTAVLDPTSDLYAPVTRNGYQARRRHAVISYDPGLLKYEDHEALSDPPEWLHTCAENLSKTFSGHYLKPDPRKLCERETKWNEEFLESLHNDLRMARLGAASTSLPPLHILKPRRPLEARRPHTPEVGGVDDAEETAHQQALTLQRMLRGRAVQYLMYEGRCRAAELTEELKTTHGLQKEDRIKIAYEQSKCRDYTVKRLEADARNDAISSLVDELCGGAVSSALDFLEKELRRLKEERRQHAFILVALREKSLREAAEAGRRQKEERRRREHDEMFKMVVGITQNTVDDYLNEVIVEGVELAAEEEAVKMSLNQADKYDEMMKEHGSISTAEQHEIVADLVQQFLLPHTHKTAVRHRIQQVQSARLKATRDALCELVKGPAQAMQTCIRCGGLLDDMCRCRECDMTTEPRETPYRHDWRWKKSRERPMPPPKSHADRFPMAHDMRCMLSILIDDVVRKSRADRKEKLGTVLGIKDMISERMEVSLDSKHYVDTVVDIAIGAKLLPVKPRTGYAYTMTRVIPDAIDIKAPIKGECPKELPSEIRRRIEEENKVDTITCRCLDDDEFSAATTSTGYPMTEEVQENVMLLPSELRALEDMKRCKCDVITIPSTPTNFYTEGDDEREGEYPDSSPGQDTDSNPGYDTETPPKYDDDDT